MNIENEIIRKKEELAAEFQQAISKPLTVAVIGDGGAGKSTLINTLFGTDLPTGHAKPTTKEAKNITAKSSDGKHSLSFIDLPGTGEKGNNYVDEYLKFGLDSDVIIWSINTENRNVEYTIDFINNLVKSLDAADKIRFFNKILFVITKVDLIRKGKWTFKKYNNYFRVYANKDLKFILDQKVAFVRFSIIKEFEKYIQTTIYFGRKPKNYALVKENFLQLSNNKLICTKLIDGVTYQELIGKYPDLKSLLDRVVKSQSPIVCSSSFKYNLTTLLLSIIDKVETGIFSIEHFIDVDRITQLTQKELDQVNNIEIKK